MNKYVYKEGYGKQTIDYCKNLEGSVTTLSSYFNTPMRIIKIWYKEHEEFRDCFEIASNYEYARYVKNAKEDASNNNTVGLNLYKFLFDKLDEFKKDFNDNTKNTKSDIEVIENNNFDLGKLYE